MTEAVKKLIAQLGTLSPEERADIAHYLIHSLDEGEDAEVEASWDAELTRRLTDIKSGTAVGKPAEEVFRRLREKYS